MSKKVENVQALRGIAILAVLLPHVQINEQKFGQKMLGGDSFFHTGNAGVDLFFVISGFVMVTVAAGKFRGLIGTADFLYRRIARIYPLYWVFTLLVLAIYLKHPEMVNTTQTGAGPSLWKTFLLFPQQGSPLIAQGWTLVHEMYFYIVFALLLQLPPRLLGFGLCVWAGAVIAGDRLIASPTPTLGIIFNPLTIEFILGCFIALAIRRGIDRFGIPMMLLGTGGAIMAVFVDVPKDAAWIRVLFWGLPSAALLYGAAAAEKRGSFCLPKPLSFIGDISYSMYLSHGLVFAVGARAYWKIVHPSVPVNVVGCLILCVMAIAFAAVCYFVVERPMIKFFRRNPFAPKNRAMVQVGPAKFPPIIPAVMQTEVV